jgi:hypothetical protein
MPETSTKRAKPERPIRDGRITFAYQGKMETGVVELIAPDDWEKRDLTPTVTIVRSPSE